MLLGLDSPSLVIRMFFSSRYREGLFHMRVISPVFRKKSGSHNAFLTVVFQVPWFMLKISNMSNWHILGVNWQISGWYVLNPPTQPCITLILTQGNASGL